jgi:hypothetical protein
MERQVLLREIKRDFRIRHRTLPQCNIRSESVDVERVRREGRESTWLLEDRRP